MIFVRQFRRALGACLLALLLGGVAFAQSGAAFYGPIGEGVPTFLLTTDGGTTVPAGLWSGGEWWTGTVEALPAGRTGVQYFVDAPWDTSIQAERISRTAELSPEPATARRKRLETGWTEAGFTFVATAAGKVPVRAVDIDLAKQAAAQADKVAQLSAPENLRIIADGGAEVVAPDAGAAAAPAWQGYIGHAITIVVTLLLGAVIVKVLLLGSGEDWERVG